MVVVEGKDVFEEVDVVGTILGLVTWVWMKVDAVHLARKKPVCPRADVGEMVPW